MPHWSQRIGAYVVGVLPNLRGSNLPATAAWVRTHNNPTKLAKNPTANQRPTLRPRCTAKYAVIDPKTSA